MARNICSWRVCGGVCREDARCLLDVCVCVFGGERERAQGVRHKECDERERNGGGVPGGGGVSDGWWRCTWRRSWKCRISDVRPSVGGPSVCSAPGGESAADDVHLCIVVSVGGFNAIAWREIGALYLGESCGARRPGLLCLTLSLSFKRDTRPTLFGARFVGFYNEKNRIE